MKIYQVLNFSDAIHCKEDKAFTSFPKALQYIEKQMGGITHIKVNKDGKYWESSWHYKKYSTDVEWAKILLDRKDLENRRYMNRDCYGIRIIEVL